MSTFRELAATGLVRVAASTGRNAQRMLRLIGGTVDARVASTKEALRARFPEDSAEADPYRLRLLGQGFGLTWYAAENAATFLARVRDAWGIHQAAGTALGVIRELQRFGLGDVTVVEDWELAAAGAGQGHWYSSFWVILGPDFGSRGWAPRLGPFPVPSLPIDGATPEDLATVRRIILDQKDAHAYPRDVVILFPGVQLLGVNVTPGTSTGSGPAIGEVRIRIGKIGPFMPPHTPAGFY